MPPIFYDDDDDDDEESFIPLRDIIFELPLSVSITPDLPIMNSLIMGNEELSTIPEKESEDNNIKSKDSYEPALLVTPLFDFNEDECFDPGGEINEIDAFLDMNISTNIENGYHDSKGDIIYL
ncbi:hypothetical protein Tco_0981304 [Tanacetum coccineum]